MTIDVDGKLWVAIYNGWKVIMFITYNLSDHGVENRETGEQFTQWDTLNKVTKFEFSLFFLYVPVRHWLSSLAIFY